MHYLPVSCFSMDSFIQPLKCFMTRRVNPKEIRKLNCTKLEVCWCKKGNKAKLLKSQQNKVIYTVRQISIIYQFNPLSSPWIGDYRFLSQKHQSVLNDPNMIEVALDIYLVEIKITTNSCPLRQVSNYHNRLEPSINT